MTQDAGQRLWGSVVRLYSVPSRPEILGVGNVLMGLIGMLEGPSRSSSPAYGVIKQWASITTWGTIQLGIGLTLLGGIALRPHVRPDIGQLVQSIAAGFGALWCTAWAVPLFLVAADDNHVSYRGGVLWLCWGVVPHLFLAFGRED